MERSSPQLRVPPNFAAHHSPISKEQKRHEFLPTGPLHQLHTKPLPRSPPQPRQHQSGSNPTPSSNRRNQHRNLHQRPARTLTPHRSPTPTQYRDLTGDINTGISTANPPYYIQHRIPTTINTEISSSANSSKIPVRTQYRNSVPHSPTKKRLHLGPQTQRPPQVSSNYSSSLIQFVKLSLIPNKLWQ